ncbi:MAG: polysaccharide biosynthesis tyrosine autokinase [Prevotellaceae bacterium]|jgi:capsular exopolysaccharide synthesis family protein|nr:polysaccharide biosynthesis tyrosine autokinase [Prevotellaceae bacterium]
MEELNSKSTAVPQFAEEEQSSFNIVEWVIKFVRFWYLFVIGAAVALAVAYYQNRGFVPRYRSETQIMLQENQSSFVLMRDFGGGQSTQKNDNQLLLLASDALVGRTVDSMPSLRVDIFQKLSFKNIPLYGETSPVGIEIISIQKGAYPFQYSFIPIDDNSFEINVLQDSKKIETVSGTYNEPIESKYFSIKITKNPNQQNISNLYFRFRTTESLIGEFARISASMLGDRTSVVKLILTGSNPARDRAFLDMHAQSFLLDNLDKKNYEAVKTISFIDEQLAAISDSLSHAELDLNSFKVTNDMFGALGSVEYLAMQLNLLEEKAKQLDMQDAYFNYLKKYLTDNIETGSIASPTSIGVQDGKIISLVEEYNKIQLENFNIGAKHPKLQDNNNRISQLKHQLYELMNSVDAVNALQRQSYNREKAEVARMMHSAPDKELKMQDFERRYKINDNYYSTLLQKRSEFQIRKAANAPDNTILQKAKTMGMINASQKKDKYSSFLIIGLLIPALFIVLRELLSFTIKTKKDIEKISKFAVIGSVPHTKHKTDEKIIAVRYPNSAFVEQLRVIRTKIELILQRRNKITILISSTESGDGKTYVSANLAGVFALQKEKVLLMDFDIRKPNLTAMLSSGRSRQGFVNYILGDITLEQAIEHKEEFGFDLMSAGVLPPNPGEFIRSKKVEMMLEELKKMYSCIIIDTSPVGLVADSYALMPITDIHLIVVRSFKTHKGEFRDLSKRMQADGVADVHIILNDVDKKKLGYGYGHGYGYSYGYGYGYKKQAENYYVTEDFEKTEPSFYEKIYNKIMRWLGR